MKQFRQKLTRRLVYTRFLGPLQGKIPLLYPPNGVLLLFFGVPSRLSGPSAHPAIPPPHDPPGVTGCFILCQDNLLSTFCILILKVKSPHSHSPLPVFCPHSPIPESLREKNRPPHYGRAPCRDSAPGASAQQREHQPLHHRTQLQRLQRQRLHPNPSPSPQPVNAPSPSRSISFSNGTFSNSSAIPARHAFPRAISHREGNCQAAKHRANRHTHRHLHRQRPHGFAQRNRHQQSDRAFGKPHLAVRLRAAAIPSTPTRWIAPLPAQPNTRPSGPPRPLRLRLPTPRSLPARPTSTKFAPSTNRAGPAIRPTPSP